ncbi:MAG TPA: DNA polymerase III subunit beta [Candidatus Andersenbacteria bacterium]|nr:DNA polymerase III subunit beta [Candidatus Andersenbacteria bacterium]
MKFTCTQENLLRGVSQAAPIAGRNSQLPILQNILVRAQHSTLSLITTDLEIGVTSIVGGKMEQEGSCVIPAKRFMEYIQQLPKNSPITLEKKEGRVFVSTKGFKAQFLSADPDEYPLLPEGTPEGTVVVSGAMFCGAISQTVFSATKEETRPEIRSVYIVRKDGGIHVAATDSFRLAEYTAVLSSSIDFSLLLPLVSAQEVVRLFYTKEEIIITLHDNYVSFESGDIQLTSRLVDGQYPKYEDIIPASHTTHIQIEKDEFLRALKTLSVFLPKESRRVSLEIRPGDGELTARVAGGEMGQGEVVLQIEGDGENVDVLMNIQYLMDGIVHFSGNVCEGYFLGPFDPVVFRRQGKEDAYVYVVMPIQAQ